MLVLKNPNTLKVSILVSDLSLSGAGRWGGAVRSFLLAQALQKLQSRVEILGFDFTHASEPTLESEIPVYKLSAHNYPKFFSSASQLLKKIDGDIIYAMRPKATTFGLSLFKKIRTHRPVILDIDDWELSWYGGEKWKYKPSFQQLARDILKSNGALRNPDHPIYLKWMENMVDRADIITIHTQFLKAKFGGVYVPNGKDTNLFNPENYNPEESRARYGLSGYRVLMFPGAPRPYKGLEDVLMALDKLNRPDLRLAIVGGSPYDRYDAQLMERWGRWIIQLPKSSPSVMPEIVSGAHIIVVPQRNTPAALAQFPLKITDGMAMAKPILATSVGDIPEILGDTGYLVEPSSPECIADKIQWIFDHFEEAHEKGKLARKKCIEYYSIDAMAVIMSKIIQSL
ncbi:MAG: glycosyltransferase family 4 protein [Scytonema sp. PMC 1070.18]|nr:glycosyltransferase family 4 protein [Scytonema sp. PMC 1070.18]